MRIVLDNDGYLSKWILNDNFGIIPDEKEQIVPNIENLDIHTFYKEYRLYHLVDGKLVKDENRQAQLDAEKAKEQAEVEKKKALSLQEKIALFVDAIEIDEKPVVEEGFVIEPYFDKENMKFAWKTTAVSEET